MTEENCNYRTSQIMLRNQFPGDGRWNIPIIPKFQEKPGDFDDLLLIGFDKTSTDEQKHNARMVHFFLYDYRFERVWEKPDTVLEKLRPYRAVLSLRISACIWKWRRFCSCTTCSATAGAAHTGHHRDCALSQPSTGTMRRRSISALLELKKEALLPYRPIWHRHTTTDAIKRNGF